MGRLISCDLCESRISFLSRGLTHAFVLWTLQQTIWLFFRDMLMGLGLMVAVGPPIVAAIIIIVQKGGPYLALYLWAFMLVLSLVLMALYPILIAPLFNKFTPVSLFIPHNSWSGSLHWVSIFQDCLFIYWKDGIHVKPCPVKLPVHVVKEYEIL